MFSALTPLPSPSAGSMAGPAQPPLRVVPFPAAPPVPGRPAASNLPAWPAQAPPPAAPPSGGWLRPFSVLPHPATGNAAETIHPALPFPPIPRQDAAEAPLPPAASAPPPPADPAQARPAPPEADFTDDDLREALAPLVGGPARDSFLADDAGIHPLLEPMLRSVIRRSLAEYSPASRPFQPPRALDRFLWRLNALFTSRSYEEILFEKTHRFQVEEVFALDAASLALISHASCDPARHASAKRIEGTVHRLALQLRDDHGAIRPSFDLPDGRTVLAREGRHVVLIALVRGRPNDLILADLEFSLIRIEDHFEERFAPGGGPLLHALQPFLEDCLLIQAPASAA